MVGLPNQTLRVLIWPKAIDAEMSFRVIVNYADYGLQFFTSDGVFYVEVNLGVCDP